MAAELKSQCYVKKGYIKPQLEILDMEAGAALLAGSGDDPYWVPPEEKEGCETPWWCP